MGDFFTGKSKTGKAQTYQDLWKRATTPYTSAWNSKSAWQRYTQGAKDQLSAMGLWPPPYPEWSPENANLKNAPKQAQYGQAIEYKFGNRSFYGMSEQATPKRAQLGLAATYRMKQAQRENLAKLAGGGRTVLTDMLSTGGKTLLGQ